MPRYSKYEWHYVKDRVWFADEIKYKYRKGKRVVLAYIWYIHKEGLPFSVETFEDFLINTWRTLDTVNRPLPYSLTTSWTDNYLANAIPEL